MLRTRVITGLILGALLLASIFYLPPNGVLIGFGIVFVLGAWEWAGFGGLSGAVPRTLYAALVAAVLIVAWRSTQQSSALITLFAVSSLWWVVAFLWLLLAPSRHQRLVTLACGFLVLPPAFVALVRLDTVVGGFARGPLILLWLIFIVCSADIGAYFAGRAFGKHKLAPRVSPGKTWEGAIGGLLSVALMAWGGAAYFGLPQLPAVLFGMGVGAFSIIGDLTESMFKRAADLKDSGKLLPGHGGLLDRLDSVTAAAPLYALGLYGSGVLK